MHPEDIEVEVDGLSEDSVEAEEVAEDLTDRLPNGFELEDGTWVNTYALREMSGFEEDLISDERVARRGDTAKSLLAACLTRLGSIEDKAEIAALVPRICDADATFLLLKLRVLSLGAELVSRYACPSRGCRHEANYRVDLTGQSIGYRDTAPPFEGFQEAIRKSSGEEVPVVLRSITVGDTAKLKTGKKEHGDKIMSFRLWLQTVSVRGKKVPSVKDMQYYSTGERTQLRQRLAMEEKGVDLEVRNECPECKEEFTTGLEIGSIDFFFPSGTPTSG